jgi:FkbM family methyltransferase
MLITRHGIAVIEGDTHVSAWVRKKRRLNIAEPMLRPFAHLVPRGGVVVDAGACIGDHTVTYAEWVGDGGQVWAFEPSLAAFNCLRHNTKSTPSVKSFLVGLGSTIKAASVNLQENAGASFLGQNGGEFAIVMPLDWFGLESLHFLKMDVEGYECELLKGAMETIGRFRPAILAEVNAGALLRAGASRAELLELLEWLGYDVQITDQRLNWEDPQYDVICLPR